MLGVKRWLEREEERIVVCQERQLQLALAVVVAAWWL